MKYKEGDTVKIKKLADLEKYRGELGTISYGGISFAEEMEQHCEEELIVTKIVEHYDYYELKNAEDNTGWCWYEWMFEENYPNKPVETTTFVNEFLEHPYVQQLLSATIAKLIAKEAKAEAKLYNIRKKLIAYRQLQEKYETTI